MSTISNDIVNQIRIDRLAAAENARLVRAAERRTARTALRVRHARQET